MVYEVFSHHWQALGGEGKGEKEEGTRGEREGRREEQRRRNTINFHSVQQIIT